MTTYLDRMEREAQRRSDEEFAKIDSLGRRYLSMPGRKEKSLKEKLWDKVDKRGPFPEKRYLGRCWIWTCRVNDTSGYPSVWHNGKYVRLHRLVYEEEVGELIQGLVIGHKCNVKICCRPSHLEQITSGQNTRDAIRDGLRKPGPYSKEVMS